MIKEEGKKRVKGRQEGDRESEHAMMLTDSSNALID